jgi:hypothetical protein
MSEFKFTESDGVKIWSNLMRCCGVDEDVNILQRPGGSVSLYFTRPGGSAHIVIFDTLGKPMGNIGHHVVGGLREMHRGLSVLFEAEANYSANPEEQTASNPNEHFPKFLR